MSSISVRFYSFTFIRFSMNMVLPQPLVISFILSVLIPSGDTESISEISTRYLAARTPGLVEMMGIEPMTPCLQGRCSPS